MVTLEDWQLNLMCVWESYRRLGFKPDQIHFILQINPHVKLDDKPVHELLVALYTEEYVKDAAPDFASSVAHLSQEKHSYESIAAMIEDAAKAYNGSSEEEAAEILKGWAARVGYPEGGNPFLQLATAIMKKGVIMPAIREHIANAKGFN